MVKKATIGVFGHYGHLNLGDEAIIVALLESIRRQRPEAELLAFSDNPEDTSCRHRVPAFPIARTTFVPGMTDEPPARTQAHTNGSGWTAMRTKLKKVPLLGRVLRAGRWLASLFHAVWEESKFLPKAYRSLQRVDLLIVAGSNQFLDNWGGPWVYPYDLLKWSILAKMAGSKLAFMSVGAGPIDRLLSRIMVRTALLFSNYTSFRDEASRRLIETAGFRRGGAIYPDLAFSLSLRDGNDSATTRAETSRRPTVGINPMSMFHRWHWCYPDEVKYQRYVEKLAAFSARLIREGYPVFFFATQVKDDDPAVHDVCCRLRTELGESAAQDSLFRRSHSVSELMATVASADIVIATRFHGTVLALRAERPVLAICYYRKARDLMREMGQADYAVDLEDFDVEDGWQMFTRLERNRIIEQQRIQQKNAAYREALERQYEHVLGRLLPAAARENPA